MPEKCEVHSGLCGFVDDMAQSLNCGGQVDAGLPESFLQTSPELAPTGRHCVSYTVGESVRLHGNQ